MKYILLLLLLFPAYLFGQSFGPEDTCFNNTVTLITANSARLSTNTANGDVAGTSVLLKYVRQGHTDTTTSTAAWPNGLRNLVGLTAATRYIYYWAFSNGSEYEPQHVAYAFTTLASTITYTPQFNNYQYPYIKFDSGMKVPRLDTSLYRAPTTSGGDIVFKSPNFYGYNGSYWIKLAVDSAGILPALNLKIDSVTVTGDSLFYYCCGGVAHGYILPINLLAWKVTGNAGTTAGTNFVGTTDSVDLVGKTKSLERFRWNARGALGLGTGTDYGTAGYSFLTNGAASAPTYGYPTTPINNLLAATGTNTINNTSFKQEWQWSNITANDGFKLSINSATGHTFPLFRVSNAGANGSSNLLSYAAFFENTRTGTTSTNIGAWFKASGGTTNNAIYSDAGNVLLNQSGGGIGGFTQIGENSNNTGVLKFAGITSGKVSIQPQSIAGTYNFNLPITAGTIGDVLTSAGGGSSAMTWSTPTSGTVTSVSGTTNRITSTGGTAPVIDISASYVGQSSITTHGTITSGGLGTGSVIGKPTMTLGSDADGDMYYRASGVLTRLPKGTAAQHLTGGTIPVWVDTVAAGSSGANTALSNLASVAINTSLLPGTDSAIDLGSTSKTWKNIYAKGLVGIGTTSPTAKLSIVGVAQGPIATFSNGTNSNYIQFSRSPATANSYFGSMGGPELNWSFNMKYPNGSTHEYGDDNSKGAIWGAMNGDYWGYQWAPSGVSGDIWTNSGSKLLIYQTTNGHMILNTDAASIAGGGYDAMFTVPRDDISIAGLNDLVIEGKKTKGAAGDIYMNVYNSGDMYLAHGGGSVGIGNNFSLGATLDVTGTFRSSSTNTLSILAGTGTRIVTASSTGVLSATQVATTNKYGSFSGVGTATTTFTVTFGGTLPSSTYYVNVTPTAALSAALFYVTNKTTTTFDVMYLAGLTGTVTFDWTLIQ